ncbi:MAG: glucoamylase family protein [Bacteroidota bacterium]
MKLAALSMLLLPLALLAQPLPDLVIFDEDDAIGSGYYDASFGLRTLPSQLFLLSNADKLPIISSHSFIGAQAGLLRWTSAADGNWQIYIASVGWEGRDASGYDSLTLYLNGPASIAETALPKIGLESMDNAKTPLIDLGAYLTGGVDADSMAWQRITIPLSAFEPFGGFDLAAFKDVNFHQNQADNSEHTLWIDDIRIISVNRAVDSLITQGPSGLNVYAGDQSVNLHWNAIGSAFGYNAYRAASEAGPYTRINTTTIGTTGMTDLAVSNQQAYWYYATGVNEAGESPSSDTVSAVPATFADDSAFMDYVERAAVNFFWYEANPATGLIRDRSEPWSASSIASVGFGLTALGIGVERGWLSRTAAADRTLTALRTLFELPQGPGTTGVSGYKGWFYHFLDMNSGLRTWDSELSSIDTGLLLAGVLYAKEFYDGADGVETDIRAFADSLVNRVDWQWMTNGDTTLTMGWFPDGSASPGFINARWIGYNEAMILYLIGMGANVNALLPQAWTKWTGGYSWQTHYGYSYVHYPVLFIHQYSHAWVDFRIIQDAYMRERGITYFENSRRATLAQWEYCKADSLWGYSDMIWGLTACDGPGTGQFFGYIERGGPPARNDDGTIAPTAAGGSMPFTPEISLPTLQYFYNTYRSQIWTQYGFRDAFNLTAGWWDRDVIGIDQGALLLMIENYRTQSVWQTFMNSTIIQQGLSSAGFSSVTSAAALEAIVPTRPFLSQNFPNPFNPLTIIEFSLPRRAPVNVTIYDALGRQLLTLVDATLDQGVHRAEWNAASFASGIYFCRMIVDGELHIRKLMLLR